jgi:MerR family Zn(II)-responsive transcriptional regulator of zntA
VRYYSRIGLLKPGRGQGNGYKLFTPQDLVWLCFVRKAQYLGFRLSEITEILEKAAHGDSPCPQVRDIIRRRIKENRQRLDELIALQERMEQALASWEKLPNRLPDGHTLCHLIELSAED